MTVTSFFGSFLIRVESVKLKFMMVNGKREAGLIVSAGKDGLIKYWDIEQ